MQEHVLSRADVGESIQNTTSGSEKGKENKDEKFAIPRKAEAAL